MIKDQIGHACSVFHSFYFFHRAGNQILSPNGTSLYASHYRFLVIFPDRVFCYLLSFSCPYILHQPCPRSLNSFQESQRLKPVVCNAGSSFPEQLTELSRGWLIARRHERPGNVGTSSPFFSTILYYSTLVLSIGLENVVYLLD